MRSVGSAQTGSASAPRASRVGSEAAKLLMLLMEVGASKRSMAGSVRASVRSVGSAQTGSAPAQTGSARAAGSEESEVSEVRLSVYSSRPGTTRPAGITMAGCVTSSRREMASGTRRAGRRSSSAMELV